MSRLIGLYPASWRARYETELRALLADRPPTRRDRVDLVRGALDARLHPELIERGAGDRSVPLDRRLSGLLAFAGGLTWAGTYASVALAEGDSIDASGIWLAFFFMATSLIGSDLALHAQSLGRGLTAAVICLILVFVLPWGVNFAAIVALGVILGAGGLGLATVRAGLPRNVRRAVLILGFAIPFVLIFPAGAASNWGYGPGWWLQGFIFVPYGLGWMFVGARMAIQGGPTTTNPPSGVPTEATAWTGD